MKTIPLVPLHSLAFAAAGFFLAATAVSAYEIDILHDTNPPPQSEALLTYLDSVRPESHILVGFDGADIGEGPGDGRNEVVGVSFAFEAPDEVFGALLSLEITKGGSGSDTDNISFADNLSPWGEEGFGYANALIAPVPEGVRSTVHVNLARVPGRAGDGFFYDVLELLEDGTFDVAFTDDSIVHSMRLQIRTTPLPTFEDLAELVRDASLHHGIENALLAKVGAAHRAADRGHYRDARGSLGAFLNHVRAQRGKKIPADDADAFSALARELLDALPPETESSTDGLGRSVSGDFASSDAQRSALSPGAPNPFSESTAIRFELFRRSNADLAIYDVTGRRIRTIQTGISPAGRHLLTWDGRNDGGSRVADGTYFVRLRANGRIETERVVLLNR